MKKIYQMFFLFTLLLGYNGVNAQCDVTISSTDNDVCPGSTVTLTANVNHDNSLTTLYSSGNGAYPGNMFDVTATNGITISSFDGNLNVNSQIEIYYKIGTYVGSETVPANWTLIGTAAVTTNGPGVATAIPIPINITIPAGQTYAFYITTNNSVDRLSYTVGTAVGTPLVSDANLQVFEGCGLDYPFGNSGALMITRQWHGTIHYSLSASPYTLTTTLAAGNAHRGNMFDVVAINNVKIKSFDAHPQANTEIAVYYKTGSFVGFESNVAVWTLIGAATVVAQPTGTATPVPVVVDVTIPAGQTYAFYVTSTTTGGVSLNYTNGTTQNAVYTSDANIQFLEGVGLEYPFTNGSGSFNTPRIFNGIIHYEAEVQDSYVWSTGETTSDIDVAPLTSTTYSVSVTSGACTSTNSFDLDVNVVPVINLGADFTLCFGDVDTLDAGTGFSSIDWSNGAYYQVVVLEAAAQTAGSTEFTVLGTTAEGCESADTIIIDFNLCGINCGVELSATDTNICAGDSIDITAEIPLTPITTTYVAGNGSDGNMFDIVAINTVTIDHFDCNLGSDGDVEVYYKVGSYLGSEEVSADWTLVGSAIDVVAQPEGRTTPVPVTVNITIPAGETYAFYVTSPDGGINYTDGTNESDVYVEDANIQILEGVGKSHPFGGTYRPRIFNGVVYYTPQATYAWSTLSTDSTITVAPNDTTTYSVDVLISGCVTTINESIVINASSSTISLGVDSLICQDQEMDLDAGAGFVTYTWNDGATDQIYTVDGAVEGVGTYTYSVIVEDVNGCFTTDTVVVTVDACLGVNISNMISGIYPNPAQDNISINVELSGNDEVEINILNSVGQIVSEIYKGQSNGSFSINTNVSEYKSGLYFIQLKANGETSVHKLVIE